MSLNSQERRELLVIERALSRQDPALATLLTHHEHARPDPVPRWIALALLAVAATLLIGGALLDEPSLRTGAALVLIHLPVAWLVGIARVQQRSTG